MADEFLDAIMQRTGDAGFDIQYSNKYARPTLEKLAANVRSKMDVASKTDRPAKRERKSRSESVRLTPEEQAYKDYDDARQKLTTFLGETLNTPKGVSDENATLTEIVNAVSKGRREQQYAAPATSTPESPVPAPVPAPTPTAASTPTMSEAESTGYAKLESAMFPEGVEVGTRPPETVKLESNMFPEGVEVAATAPSTTMAESPTPAAKPVIDEARMASLFRKTTGTNFNPKSRVDKERMAQLTSFVEQDTDMLNKSDTRIALDFYKTL